MSTSAPSFPARRPFLAAWLRASVLLLPSLAAGLAILAAGDVARMIDQAHRFLVGPIDFLALALILGGIYLWTGFWVLAGAGLLLALVSEGAPDDLVGRAAAAMGRLVRGTEARTGAWMIGTCVGLGVFLGAVVLGVWQLAQAVNTPALAGVAAGGIAAAGLAGGVLVAWVTAALLRWAIRLPGVRPLLAPRVVSGLAVGVLACGAAAAMVFERDIFKEIDGWGLFLPVIAVAVGAVLLLARRTAPVGTPPRRRVMTAAGAAALAIAITASGLLWAGSVDGARALFLSFGRNGAQVANWWSRVFDFDRDGASTFLGGIDCAPWDPHIYPGAPEIVDNGIDEDCLDGDLKSAPPALQRPRLTHPVPLPSRPDVLLISIDGLRRDALGIHGAPSDRTPRLDRLAAESVVFEDAIAPASWTMPAFAAILTGRFAGELPGFYGASRFRAVPDDIPLLFEPFSQAGYRTVAVTAGLQLDRLGLDRGLDDWRSVSTGPRGRFAGPVAELAAEVLEEAAKDKPLFLWVHLIDPHYPYDPPPAFRRFGTDRRGLYAGEVAYADHAVGQVLEALAQSGREERTLVVFFSDHGEAFREHGRDFHGVSVYAEEVRVPLMIRVPGVTPGRRPELVSTLDLGPTLWDLAGLADAQPSRGLSLAPLLAGTGTLDRGAVFSEQTRRTQEFALTTPTHRLRYDRTLNRYELFDRADDPDEQTDVARRLPHVAREMRVELTRTMAAIDAVANRNLGEVLLRTLPRDYELLDEAFVGGPELAAYQASREGRQCDLAVVLRARGALEDASKVELRVDVRSPSGASLGNNRREVGDGTYAPARWRKGDLIRHTARLSLKRDPPKGSQACLSLVVDQTPLLLRSGALRTCVPIP